PRWLPSPSRIFPADAETRKVSGSASREVSRSMSTPEHPATPTRSSSTGVKSLLPLPPPLTGRVPPRELLASNVDGPVRVRVTERTASSATVVPRVPGGRRVRHRPRVHGCVLLGVVHVEPEHLPERLLAGPAGR